MTHTDISLSSRAWTPQLDDAELDEQLGIAMQRVAASIGFGLAFDKARMAAMREGPAGAQGTDLAPREPLFSRAGDGGSAPARGRIGESVSLEDAAKAVQREFQTGAEIAFRNGRLALRTGAEAFLREAGVEESARETILDAADAAFTAPGKGALAWEAAPLMTKVAMPATQAIVGGLAGAVLVFLASGMLPFAFFTGVLIGGTAYYLTRARIRRKADDLLDLLPRRLYILLAGAWNEGARRYAEAVNAAARRE